MTDHCWFKSKSRFFIGILCILVILFTISGSAHAMTTVCQDGGSKKTAREISEFSEPNLNPCDDFYSYVCDEPPQYVTIEQKLRGILEAQTIDPKDKEVVVLIKGMQYFYNECLNETEIEHFGPKSLQTMSKITEDFKAGTKSFGSTLGLLHHWGVSAFFLPPSIVTNPLFKSGKNIVRINQGGLTLSKEDYFREDPEFLNNYLNYTATMLFQAKQAPTFKAAVAKARRILSLETQLANATVPEKNMTDLTQLYQISSKEQLSKLLNNLLNLNMDEYWATLAWTNISQLAYGDTMVITPAYFTGLKGNLTEYTKEELADYMIVKAIERYIQALPSNLRDPSDKFFMSLAKITTPPERWLYCVEEAVGQYALLVDRLYVRQYAPTKEVAEKTDDLYAKIQNVMNDTLSRASIFDGSGTRRQDAIDKVSWSPLEIGFDEGAHKASLLYSKYGEKTKHLSDQGGYFNNLWENNHLSYLARIGIVRFPGSTYWRMDGLMVNPYYDQSFTVITLPSATLSKPFIDPDYTPAMNFGGLGSVLAQELVHSVDNIGLQFDQFGILTAWNPDLKRNFDLLAQCFYKQYGKIDVYVGGKRFSVDNRDTLSELIAAHDGLKLAWKAYKNSTGKSPEQNTSTLNVSNDQQFFMGFARGFCDRPNLEKRFLKIAPNLPAKEAVNGAVGNMFEFNSAFQCKRSVTHCDIYGKS